MAEDGSDFSGSRRKRKKTVRFAESEQQGFVTGENLNNALQNSHVSPTMATTPTERAAKRQKRAENKNRDGDGKTENDQGANSSGPRRARNGMLLPSFSPENLLIGRWNPPAMDFSSFPDISGARRAEKARRDEVDRRAYVDDGSDDWYGFEGRVASYTEPWGKDNGQMARAIASNFMNRAKVAHWASRKWADFEDDELTIRTQAAAHAEPDPVKRMELLADSLCEVSRLEVFELIKERLCNEIFLEVYDHKRLALERDREDSVLYAIAHPGRTRVFPQAQRQQIPEGEKTVRTFQPQPQSTIGTFSASDRDRRVASYRIPVFTTQYRDAEEQAEGSARRNSWFSRFCRNCGEDLDDGRCPRCKFVEGMDDDEPEFIL
ncbi:hypothetical protein CBER1_04462 [Cercospora berteroae]|uniref:Uncharacterized protein n=1 Tax=Cercospora berteroae TaxID=357750 RepID=A0A2S6CGM7_9PEZI|nr:hypothetical protein CBER1_04462 [Cercospora berteroae]